MGKAGDEIVEDGEVGGDEFESGGGVEVAGLRSFVEELLHGGEVAAPAGGVDEVIVIGGAAWRRVWFRRGGEMEGGSLSNGSPQS